MRKPTSQWARAVAQGPTQEKAKHGCANENFHDGGIRTQRPTRLKAESKAEQQAYARTVEEALNGNTRRVHTTPKQVGHIKEPMQDSPLSRFLA